MPSKRLDIHEEEQKQILGICQHLRREANSIAVLVLDKNGQEIAISGELGDLDTTSLASLAAGNVAATGGIASLLSEKEFSGQFHEGEKTSIHISIVKTHLILLVLFDDRSSLGLVRLRLKKATAALGDLITKVEKRPLSGDETTILEDLTDADIDSLFSD